RIVRGAETPLGKLGKDVSGWTSFRQGAATPVGTSRISEPFLSPTAGTPVVAATTTVSVDGRVRAYVELELAVAALHRVIGSDVRTIALALLMFGIACYGFLKARADGARELAAEQVARAEAERRSRIDPLTTLFNRRHAVETIEQELARSGRDGGGLGLLMFDVDRFKQINDQFGHAGGDAVLIEIARRLRAGVRVYDTVARVGGGEFCVVVPSV